METKLCKHCQTEIPKKAKVCPNCKKKQGGVAKWIVIAIVVVLLIGSIGGSDEDSSGNSGDNSSVNNTGNVENNNSDNKDENKDSEEKEDNIFYAGEYLETDDLKISYLSCQEYKSDNQFIQPKDGYVYYRLEFEFENIGNSDEFVSYFDFTGYADGYAIEQTYLLDDALSATLSAGKKTKGAVYFEVPADAVEVTAEYEMNYWTEEKVIFVIK